LDPSTAKFNQENQYKIDRSFLASQFKGGEQEIVNLMRSGKTTDVVSKLRGVWPSLPGGSQENIHTSAFYKRLEKFLSESGVQVPQVSASTEQLRRAPAAKPSGAEAPQVSLVNVGSGTPQASPSRPSSTTTPATPTGGNGPTAPFLPSYNPDNFLTLYSRMVYNIVG
jgi:hypothetical protein